MNETRFVRCPLSEIKIVQTTHPAYARYFRFLGVLVDTIGGMAVVQTYGPCDRWLGVALVRK